MLAQEHAPKWKPSGPTAATAMQVSLCPKQVVLADCIPTKETTLGSLNSLPKGRPQARPGPGGAGQQHLPPPGAPDLGEGQTAPGGPDTADEGPEPLSEEPLPEKATPTDEAGGEAAEGHRTGGWPGLGASQCSLSCRPKATGTGTRAGGGLRRAGAGGAPAGAAGQTTWDTAEFSSTYPDPRSRRATRGSTGRTASRPHGHLSGPKAPWFGSRLGLQRPARPREALVGPPPHRPFQRCRAGGQGGQNPGRPPGRIRHPPGSQDTLKPH